MTISASMVKELREKTGVGMMDCKKALQETSGNIDDAIKVLREKGLSKAAKKSDREAKEGRLFTSITKKNAVLLELNCETDFVAKSDQFIELGKQIVAAIVDQIVPTVDDIKSIQLNGRVVSDLIADAVLQLGENIMIGNFKQRTSNHDGMFSDYVHGNGKIGVIIEFNALIDAALGKDIAMQVAAMNPPYVSPDQVPSNDLENERDILKKQALSEGKPEAVADKIVAGRIAKFYKENCLTEQQFVKDNDKTIQSLLSNETKVISFERFSLE